ncbi:acyl-CoA thioesterase [Simiduia agarivorans]|uniref:Acyl-CoA thioesterase 2 n=1 Tax=Simiduia agarivorans (strain DSM 21679 / JCM 13881 / BCRC 17597 / SA1) TaxID=1117647 RepID=K4KF88_SIMAS|nr:acyl-CoA thioesterase II [Simiduia agarivorans]AFU97621.1 palmitoyl-CoA hydrolase [Simiduia agarivorans SA1 = DSM 21679]
MTNPLLNILDIEQLDLNLFRSRQHQENHRRHLFGGQVLGQALMAAARTVSGRQPHSMHAYFLRAGTSEMPVIYDVEPVRDGGSFSTRRVVARQKGRPIFNMACSFHIEESGFEHEKALDPMPPAPESLSKTGFVKGEVSDKDQSPDAHAMYFDLRSATPEMYFSEDEYPAHSQFWMRAASKLPDDPLIHCAALAYASDIGLMATSTLPHPTHIMSAGLMPASIDHAMWFHRQFRIDDWLLYSTDSPWAGGARGLNRGLIYNREGHLVASTAQEGLIRPIKSQ